jgi:hypothetical protein
VVPDVEASTLFREKTPASIVNQTREFDSDLEVRFCHISQIVTYRSDSGICESTDDRSVNNIEAITGERFPYITSESTYARRISASRCE